MKQAEDNATVDMYGDAAPIPKPAPEKYTFWVEVLEKDNQLNLIEWRGLTKTQAERMHKATDKHLPNNVKAYGWEVMS